MYWQTSLSIYKPLNVLKRVITFVLLFFVTSLFSHAEKQKKFERANDLFYGTSLYHYFQGEYFNSLTELLIGEEKDSFIHHGAFVDVFRGGLHLSYGMDKEAHRLFESVLSENDEGKKRKNNISQQTEMRAWFYLGKLLYKKNLPDQALNYFLKVDKALPTELHDEYVFLKSKTLQQLTNEDRSIKITDTESTFFPQPDSDSIWWFYITYNTAMESIKTIDSSSLNEEAKRLEKNKIAKRLLGLANQINQSRLAIYDEELLALRDRSLISSGFIALSAGSHQQAIKSFKQVRRENPLVTQALLGYGWAAIKMGDDKAALAPLQLLSRYSLSDSSVQEAMLAIPFIYERMNQKALAVSEYKKTIQEIDREMVYLKQLKQKLQVLSSSQISRLLNENSVFWLKESVVPQFLNDESNILLDERFKTLLSKNNISVLINKRQDILWLNSMLEQQSMDIETIDFVIGARAEKASQSISDTQVQLKKEKLKSFKAEYTELKKRHHLARQDQRWSSVIYLVDSQEARVNNRIDTVNKRLKKIKSLKEYIISLDSNRLTESELDQIALNEYDDTVQLAKGLLHWRVANHSAEALWQQAKILKSIEVMLEESSNELGRFASYKENAITQLQEKYRMNEMAERIKLQRLYSMRLAQRVDEEIITLLMEEINRLQSMSNAYLAQANLAMARLLDNSKNLLTGEE